MPHHTTDQAVTVVLAEYDRLKNEQNSRVGFRDNLLYANLGAVAAIAAVTASARNLALLLLVPVAATVLGWTYLVNDHKVSEIGRYIRDELDPRLAALVGHAGPLFGWERAHRSDRRRRSRKVLQLVVDLTAFVLPSLVAVALSWAAGPHTAVVAVVSVVELVLVGVLAAELVIYADMPRHTRADQA